MKVHAQALAACLLRTSTGNSLGVSGSHRFGANAHAVRQRAAGYGRGRRPDVYAAQTQEFFDDGEEAVQLDAQTCLTGERMHVRYEGEPLGSDVQQVR